MELPNIEYGESNMNGGPPKISSDIWNDDIHNGGWLRDYINVNDYDYDIREYKLILRHNDNYIDNKFIASVYDMQPTIMMDLIHRIHIGSIRTSLSMLFNCHLRYPYCMNSDKYIAIGKFLLDELKTIIPHIDISQYITSLSAASKYICSGIRMTYQIDRHRLDGFNYVLNTNKLFELLKQYEKDGDIDKLCKYCLSGIPSTTLIHPCDCVQPVHINCFRKWYTENGRSCCEICRAKYKSNIKLFKYNLCGVTEDERIYFPFDDIYPVPLMTTYDIERTSNDMKLTMALCYLQYPRVENLLNTTKETDKIELSRDMFERFKSGHLPSNYVIAYDRNRECYINIFRLIMNNMHKIQFI